MDKKYNIRKSTKCKVNHGVEHNGAFNIKPNLSIRNRDMQYSKTHKKEKRSKHLPKNKLSDIFSKNCQQDKNDTINHVKYTKTHLKMKKLTKDDECSLLYRNVSLRSWKALSQTLPITSNHQCQKEFLKSVIKFNPRSTIEYIGKRRKNPGIEYGMKNKKNLQKVNRNSLRMKTKNLLPKEPELFFRKENICLQKENKNYLRKGHKDALLKKCKNSIKIEMKNSFRKENSNCLHKVNNKSLQKKHKDCLRTKNKNYLSKEKKNSLRRKKKIYLRKKNQNYCLRRKNIDSKKDNSTQSIIERQLIYQKQSEIANPNLMVEENDVQKISIAMPALVSAETDIKENLNNSIESESSFRIKTYLKILNTDKIPGPKCSIKIAGKDYKGKFNVALDPKIDRLIYNTLKDLNKCTLKNKKEETIIETCYTKLKSLFTSNKEVDRSRSAILQKTLSVIIETPIKNKTFKRKKFTRKQIRREVDNKTSSEFISNNKIETSQKKKETSKCLLSKLVGNKKSLKCFPLRKRSDVCAVTKQMAVSRKKCLSDPTIIIFEDGKKIDSAETARECRTKVTFLSRETNKIKLSELNRKYVQTGSGIEISQCRCGKISLIPSVRDVSVEVRSDEPAEVTSSDLNELDVTDVSNKSEKPVNIKPGRLTKKAESKKQRKSLFRSLCKDRQFESTTIQPMFCINGKRIYFSTNPYVPTKEDKAMMSKKVVDEFVEQITDTGIIDRPENVRIITPYKIASIEKDITPEGSKKIEIHFAGGQSVTLVTKYNTEPTNGFQLQTEPHFSDDDSYTRPQFFSILKKPLQNAINRFCSCHNVSKSDYNKEETLFARNRNPTINKKNNLKDYTVATYNSKLLHVQDFEKNNTFLEINNFKSYKENSKKISRLSKNCNDSEILNKRDNSILIKSKVKSLWSKNNIKPLFSLIEPNFINTHTCNEKLDNNLNSSAIGKMKTRDILNTTQQRFRSEYPATVYPTNCTQTQEKKIHRKWASPLLSPSPMFTRFRINPSSGSHSNKTIGHVHEESCNHDLITEVIQNKMFSDIANIPSNVTAYKQSAEHFHAISELKENLKANFVAHDFNSRTNVKRKLKYKMKKSTDNNINLSRHLTKERTKFRKIKDNYGNPWEHLQNVDSSELNEITMSNGRYAAPFYIHAFSGEIKHLYDVSTECEL